MATNPTRTGDNRSDTTNSVLPEWLSRLFSESPPAANNPPSMDTPRLDLTSNNYLTVNCEQFSDRSQLDARTYRTFSTPAKGDSPGQVVTSIYKMCMSLFQLVALSHDILDCHLLYA